MKTIYATIITAILTTSCYFVHHSVETNKRASEYIALTDQVSQQHNEFMSLSNEVIYKLEENTKVLKELTDNIAMMNKDCK